MFDKSHMRFVFVIPYIVQCNGHVTTLGSIISRILRSMGYERKTGVAPPGFLERQLKQVLDSRRPAKSQG